MAEQETGGQKLQPRGFPGTAVDAFLSCGGQQRTGGIDIREEWMDIRNIKLKGHT